MEIVKVKKINEIYLKVECEKSTAYELNDLFKFRVEGYQFSPAYKRKQWDGFIRLFDLRSHWIYSGLLPKLVKYCLEHGYKVQLEGIEGAKEFSVIEAEEYIKTLDLPFPLRDVQFEGFLHAIRDKKTLLIVPTGAGKSLILYCIMRYLEATHKKGLLIVPTIGLVEQMYKDFEAYSAKNNYKVDKNVHRVYEGRPHATNKYLTISTWQSLVTEHPDFFTDFDFYIGDEVHLHKAKSLIYIGEALYNADYRIGDTGSLDDSLTNKMVLEGLFGTARILATTKELIEQKILSQFQIKCLVLKHPEKDCKEVKNKTYQEEIAYLIESEPRNKFIVNLAASLKGNTLLLYQYVDKHGEILYKMLQEKLPNRPIYFIAGKTDVAIREEIRKIVETQFNAIIVASSGTTSTGTNIVNLHNVIFASPSKSRIKNLQSIGRVLRVSQDGSTSTLYDIADDLRFKNHENYTLKHFAIRLQLYIEQEFNYKMYRIELGSS